MTTTSFKELIEGTGGLLRDRIDQWATSEKGVPHVYPDHPPLDLNKNSYPRAAIDAIGYDRIAEDVDNSAAVEDALVQVTVYTTSSLTLQQLLDAVDDAVDHHHDDTDSSGVPYYDDWWLRQPESVGAVQADTTPGFTRYHKTRDYWFRGIATE